MTYEDGTARRNGSGYADPTAGRAIARAQAEQEAVARMVAVRRIVIELCRLEGLRADITLTDKRTGASL